MSRMTPEVLARIKVELALREHVSVKAICRRHGISPATLWRIGDAVRDDPDRNEIVHIHSRTVDMVGPPMTNPSALDMDLAAQIASTASEDGRTPHEQLAHLLTRGLADRELSKRLSIEIEGAVSRLLEAQQQLSAMVSGSFQPGNDGGVNR